MFIGTICALGATIILIYREHGIVTASARLNFQSWPDAIWSGVWHWKQCISRDWVLTVWPVDIIFTPPDSECLGESTPRKLERSFGNLIWDTSCQTLRK